MTHEAHETNETNKAKKIAYWATTGIVVFCMTGGVFELVGAQTTVEGITKLGFPAFIIPVLGLAKVLAILAIVWPGFPRLKEWAYAGIVFNMVGATATHVANHAAMWHVVVTLVITAITFASWALRPHGRRLESPARDAAAQAVPRSV
jgi:NhaP-type Na+/H+ or K+/H+ antiporter